MESSTRLILLGTLMLSTCAAPPRGGAGLPEPVTVRPEALTLPYLTSVPRYLTRPNDNGANFPTTHNAPTARTVQTLWVENSLVKVQVAPELGGPIVRAIDKASGEDLFFYEGKLKDYIPFWESGVKVCFPWHEHGVRTADQPAGYRVIREADGTQSITMFMEFSRFHEHWNRHMFGRFSNLMLTQTVTLKPDDARVFVQYRIFNPTPYRQGLDLWNDAFFPRQHTKAGVLQGDAKPEVPSAVEWIMPAGWVSNHAGRDLREYGQKSRVADYQDQHQSIFAWEIPYGFAGAYYPEVRVNRLRLFDPKAAPGTKQYFIGDGRYSPGKDISHMYNFLELWGGTNNVFEGVERWIEPGEMFAVDYAYAIFHGMGKIDYANEQLAVHVDFASHVVELGSYGPVGHVTVKLDQHDLTPPDPASRATQPALASHMIPEGRPIGPGHPLRLALPAEAKGGRLVVRRGGHVLLDQVFPLPIPADTAGHERIKQANASGPEQNEKMGNAFCFGRWYRAARYPANSTGAGRIQYRDGQLDAALATLTAATAAMPEDGEVWHLLGMTKLEKGDAGGAREALMHAVAAKQAYPPARYYLAVVALGQKQTGAAVEQLDTLLKERPGHYEALLLRAALVRDPAAAGNLVGQGDPRMQWVLARWGDGVAKRALAELLKEPGAQRRLDEFVAATEGRYVAPARLDYPPAAKR